jgi:hypothetical protein
MEELAGAQPNTYCTDDGVSLSTDAQAHFNLPPCEDPDCSIHPWVLDLALAVTDEYAGLVDDGALIKKP